MIETNSISEAGLSHESPAALATLERRIDWLEFELRKSVHQQQMMLMLAGPNVGQSALNQAQSGETTNNNNNNKVNHDDDDDDQQVNEGQKTFQARLLLDNNKWTSMPEKLELMERFITVTAKKVSPIPRKRTPFLPKRYAKKVSAKRRPHVQTTLIF